MAGNVYSLRTVEDEAGEWIARIEGGCTPEQRKRLDDWLAADPEHRAVFEEMFRHWRRLGVAAAVVGRLNHPAPAADVNVAFPREDIHPMRVFVRCYRGSIAAVATFAAIAIFLVVARLTDAGTEIYATELGVHRVVTLADDSTVDLNTATRIEVELTASQRLVRLTTGEALFTVARDSDRPFIVIAGSSVVRALGTSFAVRLTPGKTNVVVAEGRVAVSSAPTSFVAGEAQSREGAPGSATILSAGDQVTIATDIGPVAKVEHRDIERNLAWRRGVLNIQDQSLRDVVAEVERYSATRFQIADTSLNEIKVGGYFKATDVEAFVTLLEGQFPIRAERVHADLVVLKRSE